MNYMLEQERNSNLNKNFELMSNRVNIIRFNYVITSYVTISMLSNELNEISQKK